MDTITATGDAVADTSEAANNGYVNQEDNLDQDKGHMQSTLSLSCGRDKDDDVLPSLSDKRCSSVTAFSTTLSMFEQKNTSSMSSLHSSPSSIKSNITPSKSNLTTARSAGPVSSSPFKSLDNFKKSQEYIASALKFSPIKSTPNSSPIKCSLDSVMTQTPLLPDQDDDEEESSLSFSDQMHSAKSSLSSRSLHVDDYDDEDSQDNDSHCPESSLSGDSASYEIPLESRYPWFKPDMTRTQAEKFLESLVSSKDDVNDDLLNSGHFVIRPGHSSSLFPYSLSLYSGHRVYHLNIRRHESGGGIDGRSPSFSLGKSSSGRLFDNLNSLVNYYSNKPLLLVSTKRVTDQSQEKDFTPRKYVCLKVVRS